MAVRLAVLLALLLPAPASASAATTIGSSLPAWTGETLECTDPGGCTFIPRTIAGAVVAVPSDGVVVSWSARMPTAADTGPIRLRGVLLTATGATAGGGSSLSPPAVDGAVVQGSLRMPVHAGDLIGVELDDGDEVGVASHATFDSSSWSYFPLLSADRPPDSIDNDDFEALFNATIEPDVDGDGYGDETQDRCPQLAHEHARTCLDKPRLHIFAGRVGIGVVDVGRQIEIQAGVAPPNHIVPDALLKLTLPTAVKLVAIRGTAFCSSSGNVVTCPMGELPANHGHTVYLDLLALRPAVTQVRADLTTGLPAAPSLSATAGLTVRTAKPCGLAIRADGSARGTTGGDRIVGGAAADQQSGRAGDDCLLGRGGDDRLDGGEGDDDIDAGRGGDLLRGGAGNDRLVGGPGKDRFEGGPGNDRLGAVDRKRDVVRCGPGRDRATVDAVDSVASCERVKRR